MSLRSEQAYLRTRLSILNGRRRRQSDLRELQALDKDALCEQLGLQPDSISEGNLDTFEKAQLQTWLDELHVLFRPLGGAQRALLAQWARRFEVLNIKALIKGKLGGLSRREIAPTLFSLPDFLRLDHEPLLNTDDVNELLRRLLDTPYRQLARLALRRFEERQDPFLLDASLDQQFYAGLSQRVQMLPQPDQGELRQLVGRLVDRHNLIWLLRYRHNYGLPIAEVVYLSIHGGLRLSDAQLRHILQAGNLAEALAQVPRGMREVFADADNLLEIRDRLVWDLQRYAEQVIRRNGSELSQVFAYLLLRYYEIKTTNAILHAKFIRLPQGLQAQSLFGWYSEVA